MLRWAVYGLVAVGGLVAVVALIGWSLPVAHRATRTVTLAASPEAVFEAVTAFGRYPEWRGGVARVDVSGPPGVGQLIREHGRTGEIPYRIEVFDPPRRLVMRIAGARMAFGGTWTYEVAPAPSGGASLTITEDGEIYNVVFRFMARFVFGYHATMDGVLRDLTRRLGSP